jgi:hypothetical protein
MTMIAEAAHARLGQVTGKHAALRARIQAEEVDRADVETSTQMLGVEAQLAIANSLLAVVDELSRIRSRMGS